MIESVLTGDIYSHSHVYSDYFQIGSIRLVYDATNVALKVIKSDGTNANFYATGSLSARGAAGSSSGGGLVQTVYSSSSLGGIFSDSVLTDAFNAYTVDYLHTRISSLEGGSATNVALTGSGNALTSMYKSGSTIYGVLGNTFSLDGHIHSQYLTGITSSQVTTALGYTPYYSGNSNLSTVDWNARYLLVNPETGRATIRHTSVEDVPTDLYFGNANTDHWSITSRASDEANMLKIYSTAYGYVATFNYTTGEATFSSSVSATSYIRADAATMYHSGNSNNTSTPWSVQSLNVASGYDVSWGGYSSGHPTIAGSGTELNLYPGGNTLDGKVNVYGNMTSSGTITASRLSVRSSGVDGTYQDILTGLYVNYTEKNSIQTSVSTIATSSGFRFMVSNGGGSSGQTLGYQMNRNLHHFYGTLSIDPSSAPANYAEGIRIGNHGDGYSIIDFGVDTTTNVGAQTHQWWIGKDGRDNGFNIWNYSAGDVFHISEAGNASFAQLIYRNGNLVWDAGNSSTSSVDWSAHTMSVYNTLRLYNGSQYVDIFLNALGIVQVGGSLAVTGSLSARGSAGITGLDTVPTSAIKGYAREVRICGDSIYVCTADYTWKKATLTSI
jgi:hypothetical protein